MIWENLSPKLGSMIECFEDTVNPSLPYRITFNPQEIKFIQVTRTSTLKQLKGSDINCCMQIPIIFYRTPDGRISWTKCSVENIRNFIESKKEALVVFCCPSQYDVDIITDFNTKFVQKTYEQLGIQDLYEEYLEQSK